MIRAKNTPLNIKRAEAVISGSLNTHQCCESCAFFFTVPYACPCGWCAKYPSKQINTDIEHVCPLWEDKHIIRIEPVDWSFLSDKI